MCLLPEAFLWGFVLMALLGGSTARTTEWPGSTTGTSTTSTPSTPSTTTTPPTTSTPPTPSTTSTPTTPSTTPTPSTTSTTPTPPTPSTTTTTPLPIAPRCPHIGCGLDSPPVCGRLVGKNQCQRFGNVCDMMNQIRRLNLTVTATRDMYCLGLQGMVRGPCYIDCPANPRHSPQCQPTPPEAEICVRSRDGRRCKVLANTCQLRQQNCNSKPRQTWHLTDKRHCGQRMVGDLPEVCLRRRERG